MVYIILLCFVISLCSARLFSIFFRHNKGLVLLPSILTATLLAILLLNIFRVQEITVLKLSTFFIFLGAIFIYLCGIFYDYKHLSKKAILFVVGFTACCFPAIGLYINDLHGMFHISNMPVWVSFALTFGLIVLINATISSLNKTKGLASSYSIFVAVCFALYFYFFGHKVFVLFSTALAGTLLVMFHLESWSGFHTKHKPFVGTAGTLILSFSISYLALKASMNTPLHPDTNGFGFMVMLSVLSLPCIDQLISCTLHILKGSNVKTKNYHKPIHQLIHQKGLKRWYYYLLLILCVAISLGGFALQIPITIILLIDIITVICVKIFILSLKDGEISEEEVKTAKNIEQIWELQQGKPYTHPDLKNSDIKISIIVATYNSGTTIADTFNSILAQTYPNYEVLLCDGLSTDNTMEIVEKYQSLFGDKLVAVSEADKGIYDAMNKGIDRATGNIIGILNSDDFYTNKHVLERIVKSFKSSPLLEAVYGDVHYVKPSDLQRTVRYYSSKHFRPRYMRLGFMPAHPSFYCLKELYSTYGKYNLDYKVAADFDQLFRLLFIHRIRAQYIDLDFVTMRTGGASSSGIKSHLQIMKDHTKTMHSYGLSVSYFLFGIRYLYKCLSIGSGKISRFFSA